MKLLIVLTTYKRHEKILRFLNDFNKINYSLICSYIDIIISDDDPLSNLEIKLNDNIKNHIFNINYVRNKVNLGQGKNAASTINDNYTYDYYWMPGDDDIIITEEFIDLITKIVEFKPDVALLEFRQGLNLEAGTFFEGESRIISNFQECISKIIKFGKNTSTIFKRPSDWAINETLTTFSDCMYQDKVLAIFSYLESNDKKIFLKTELTATGDVDYGKLRYSMRVFVNLQLSLWLAINLFNSKYNTNYHTIDNNFKNSFWWWKYGIKAHFNRKSQLSYTNKRLFSEIFYPFKYLFRKFLNKNKYFEIN